MLEGLFSSGFKAKCKSEMKSIKARIEVVRRRAEAKQRFLKEDLAKLLVNGLDHDAFSRTIEYLALQNILDSYDFVERTCEYIKGQLSCMQKQRECPEECREAVGSLIFAAARVSDLPELRDLRDLLKERYGNSLECFVNQKFLEKLSSRPPERERKIRLLKDIASEYSLKWDVKGFEQRMAPPSETTQIQSQARKHGSNHVAPKDHNQLSMQNGSARPNNCEYLPIEKRPELASGVDRMRRSAKGIFNTREDSIPANNNEDVFRPRHRHVYDSEKKHSVREGFKRDYTTSQMDRRDATKQRPEFDKAKDQAQPGTEKRSEVAVEGTFYTSTDNISEHNKQDVLRPRHRHRHVNDSEKKHSNREGFMRECSTPEADEQDASRPRPELDKAKDQAQTGTEKKAEVARDGGKMPRSAEGTFHTRVDNIPESNKQDVLRQRHMCAYNHGNKHSDREGFIRVYSTTETGRRDVTKQRPELDKAKDQAPKGTDVEYLRRNKPVIHNPNSVMEGRPAILLPNGKEAEAADKLRSNYAKEDTCREPLRSRRSHDTIRSENVDTVIIPNNGMNNIGNRNSEITQFYGENQMERQEIPSAPNYINERDVERLRTDVLGEKSVPVPPYSKSKNSMLPPPYTKPRDSNHRSSRGYRHENSVSDRPSVDPSLHNRDHHAVESSERIQKEADQSKHRKVRDERIPPGTHYPEDFDHDHNSMIPLPKPRAIRRKHRRSLTHENLVGSSEDAGANRRSSSSRRREHLRKGLEVFSDDQKPKGDKEEKIIDKMLLHYCKKPSNYGIEKLRAKANDHPPERNTVNAVESSRDQRRGVHDEKSEHIPGHTRSFSLPPNHTAPSEDIKAFNLVKSFQPDDQERHVHPKLPDYDDFVARLAALRGQ